MLKPIAVSLSVLALLAGCQSKNDVQAPDIPFAALEDTALKDPDNPRKVFRVDFARVEHEQPLMPADLAKITPENLKALSQEQVDQIYGRLTAGPIPDGQYVGDLFFRKGDTLSSRLEEIVGGFKGRLVGVKIKKLELLGGALWKGKRFYRDERTLRNFIKDLAVLTPLLGDDTSGIMTAEIERTSILRYVLPNDEVWLLFPAKLYCGQSLLDGRRESIIIDYAYNDELPGYREQPDSLAGRNGLKVRDEIRMVRPGFYLGRAYINRMFLLNFTLYNEQVATADADAFLAGGAVAEDCWTGEQQRRVAAN
ncbi:MAG: hypothetical protein MI806_03050 [Minwuiales bacterium]|nr:hypothetical protein [Minwuiales bacterium]